MFNFPEIAIAFLRIAVLPLQMWEQKHSINIDFPSKCLVLPIGTLTANMTCNLIITKKGAISYDDGRIDAYGVQQERGERNGIRRDDSERFTKGVKMSEETCIVCLTIVTLAGLGLRLAQLLV
jgi:hypothetical protein